jgi:hypothetical protein
VHCQLAAFNPTGSAEEIRVNCYEGDAFADSRFTLSFFASDGEGSEATGAYGYVLDDQPHLPTYPDPLHYNSTGEPVEIRRSADGTWTVRFFGQEFNNNGGNVQVSALGSMPARCGIVQWSPHSLGVDARVRCVNLSSLPGFTPQWTLVYTHERAVVGDRSGTFGYLQADQPNADEPYTPPPPRNRGPRAEVHRVIPQGGGRYRVEVEGGAPPPSTAHVSVNGSVGDFCSLSGWTATQGGANADIACYDEKGMPSPNVFSLLYYSST